MPSESPSLSQAPSLSPSGNPTGQPSIAPTPAPTGTPSAAPSGAPTITPSAGPTNVPTQTPSATPSASPTEEAFKTKFSNTDVILMDIEREMSDTHLAQFEITTLEFIRDTAPHTDGYEIEVLAVTILSQTAVYPDGQNQTTNDQGERRMETKSALEVKFKTVGVVTDGSVPAGFNFKNVIVSPGFENHMDEYLYRLSMADVFFEPLKAHISMKDVVEPESKGKFVAAVVFSVIAFLVAVFAAVYAIRRHLDLKRRRRNRRMRLSGGQKCQTYSEDSAESTDDSDEENGVRPPLQLELFSPGKTDLQNVPITPRSIASPFKQDYRDKEASPLSPGTAKNAEPPSVLEETGAAIRKWLTPRMSSPQEKAADSEKKRPPRSPDPMALKASTTDKPGTLTKGNVKEGVSFETTFVGLLRTYRARFPNVLFSSFQIKVFSQSAVTIPVSFFGQNNEAESEASGTPMGSLAESAASSFFNRVTRSVFTGRPSSESYLRARNQFSPRDSFEEDEIKKKNDAIFAPRTRSVPTQEPTSNDNMKRHRTYQGSEVSDISLNEIKAGQDYSMGIRAPSSVASARSASYYNNSTTLGARALDKAVNESSLGALRSNPESYDVFAPSGPIGIVVDTSKNGPAVHSLKSTSPMVGLINAGDLIIALDDEDTRKMTAASLTRLMARKSRQKERKITLLSVDGF